MRHAAVCAVLLVMAGCGGSSPKKQQIGGPCTPQADGKSDECASGLCQALNANSTSGFCTQDCSQDPTCPDGFTCSAAGQYGMLCLQNGSCSADTDCPAGHICDTATSTCYIKVSRSLCAPCQDDAQCPQGGACFTARGSGEKFCTAPCDAQGDCPDGYACQNLPDEGGVVGKTNQCVPKAGSCDFGKGLCAPCRGDNECGGALDLCVRNVVSGEQFCGTQCSPDPDRHDCPTGFTCTDLQQDPSGTGPFQCVPNSNTCQGYCDSADEHVQTLQCGLGRSCDTEALQCQAATDGRQCSPCETNDDCAKTGHTENQCIRNNSPNSGHNDETFCAEPCPETDGNATCLASLGPGFECSQVGNEHFCTPVKGTCLSGLGRLGDDCSESGANDCVTGVCLLAGVNQLQSICSAKCTADADCGDTRFRCCDDATAALPDGGTFQSYDCASRNDTGNGPKSGMGVCAPPGGAFGDDCSPGRPPCTSGACLDLGTAQLCSQLCDTQGCPPDFTCQVALDQATGQQQSVCFPNGGGQVGGDCTFGPAACASGLCITKTSGNICTTLCTDSTDCPDTWTCGMHSTVDGQMLQICVSPDL